jgi:ribosomal protein L28
MSAHPAAVQWFKRSQRGLYAGRTRLAGNHVSPSKAQCVRRARLLPRPACAAPREHLAPTYFLKTHPILILFASVKRNWLPNVQTKKLWSDALGASLRLKVTAAALRNMDRMGGLDNYILRSTPKELGSLKAESLRFQMKAALDKRAAAAADAPAAPPTAGGVLR